MLPALGLVVAYLLGSIPSAYLAGKWTKGIDLRQHGSGNLGATNVYRVLGGKIAAVVFLADVAKGFLPAFLLPTLLVADPTRRTLWALGFGVAAIAGHAKPVYLKWKGGGKGVATASGVFLALAWAPVLLAFVVWAAVLLATGYVSLASLVASLVLPAVLLVTHGPRSVVFVASVLVAAFVFWTHRANIARLRRGEEHRFGRKREAT